MSDHLRVGKRMTACGRHEVDLFGGEADLTDDPDKVTCRSCRRTHTFAATPSKPEAARGAGDD
jgi:hypothetical protein